MYIGLHLKYPLFLSDFNQTYIFFIVLKNTEISNFIQICSVRAKLFHADGQMDRWEDRQTDMTKLPVALCNSAYVPKNRSFTTSLRFQQQ